MNLQHAIYRLVVVFSLQFDQDYVLRSKENYVYLKSNERIISVFIYSQRVPSTKVCFGKKANQGIVEHLKHHISSQVNFFFPPQIRDSDAPPYADQSFPYKTVTLRCGAWDVRSRRPGGRCAGLQWAYDSLFQSRQQKK